MCPRNNCSEGGKRFGSEDNLHIDTKFQTGEKSFTCPFCDLKNTKS